MSSVGLSSGLGGEVGEEARSYPLACPLACPLSVPVGPLHTHTGLRLPSLQGSPPSCCHSQARGSGTPRTEFRECLHLHHPQGTRVAGAAGLGTEVGSGIWSGVPCVRTEAWEGVRPAPPPSPQPPGWLRRGGCVHTCVHALRVTVCV